MALPAPTGTARLGASDLVRAGAPIVVRLTSSRQDGCAAAMLETRRHVRVSSLLGLFPAGQTGPEQVSLHPYRADPSLYLAWVGVIEGTTWREAGAEYTAGELASAVMSAVGRGYPGTVCEVFAASSISTGRALIEQTDPRAGGAATSASNAAGTVLDAGGDVLTGLGGAARGIGGAAEGIGTGAEGIGGFLRDWPILAVALAVTVVVLVRRGQL